jgi:hypothetical protein
MFKVPSDDTASIRNQRGDWHDIVSVDKSWFCYIADQELIMLPADGKGPDLQWVAVQSKK